MEFTKLQLMVLLGILLISTSCETNKILSPTGNDGLADIQETYNTKESTINNTTTGTTYYADFVNGNDANNGTSESAFKTFEKALAVIQGGDIVYFRGGTYVLGTNRPNITSNQSGTALAYTQLLAYNNEEVIIDAHNVSNYDGLNDNALRFRAGACYVKVEGLEFTSAKGYGVCLTDNAHNIEFNT